MKHSIPWNEIDKELAKICHAVEVGDEKTIPEYCEGKKRLHPSLPPCCCSQCCTCGG